MKNDIKVAIVHDYLHEVGGAESVVNAIYEIFPHADIYSATYNKKLIDRAGLLKNAKVYYPKWRPSIRGGFAAFLHKLLIANLPFYFMSLNLKKYDLVLSSTAHFAKALRTDHKRQLHISYIHTPPRFLYGYPGETRKRDIWYMKPLFWPLDTFLRIIDQITAKWPDYLLCNSIETQKRIKKFYSRDAKVINPFPEVKTDGIKVSEGDYYIVVGRLVKFKNVDLVINTCGKNGIKLKVIGTGSSEEYLRSLALKYKNIEMVGFKAKEEKYKLIAECKAMICPVAKEDFGMVPLEANAFGKPVIAYKDAGYLETVIDGKTGVFFEKLSEESLVKAIKRTDETKFDTELIKKHAKTFSKERFKQEFKEFVDSKLRI